MSLRPALLIRLHVQPGVRPIAGLLADATGRHREFEGWIQLVSLLHDAVDPRGRGASNLEERNT